MKVETILLFFCVGCAFATENVSSLGEFNLLPYPEWVCGACVRIAEVLKILVDDVGDVSGKIHEAMQRVCDTKPWPLSWACTAFFPYGFLNDLFSLLSHAHSTDVSPREACVTVTMC